MGLLFRRLCSPAHPTASAALPDGEWSAEERAQHGPSEDLAQSSQEALAFVNRAEADS